MTGKEWDEEEEEGFLCLPKGEQMAQVKARYGGKKTCWRDLEPKTADGEWAGRAACSLIICWFSGLYT